MRELLDMALLLLTHTSSQGADRRATSELQNKYTFRKDERTLNSMQVVNSWNERGTITPGETAGDIQIQAHL